MVRAAVLAVSAEGELEVRVAWRYADPVRGDGAGGPGLRVGAAGVAEDAGIGAWVRVWGK